MDTRLSPVTLLARHRGGAWSARPLGASGFCATWRAEGPDGRLFVKSLPAAQAETLTAEADGLEALRATSTIEVPSIVGCWADDMQDLAVLALRWLDFAPMQAGFGVRFGRALAALHASTRSEGDGRFGWGRDNFLGATPQANGRSSEGGVAGWTWFFGCRRLGAMRERLDVAGAPLALTSTIDRVIAALPTFFDDGYVPRPSLVHGDLWSGNWGCASNGAPVIFDPAVSRSDAESELAMMELFGSPPEGFWSAYRDGAGIAAGYERRRGLYQLYHVLNHELLFGGYARRAMAIMQQLLQSVRP